MNSFLYKILIVEEGNENFKELENELEPYHGKLYDVVNDVVAWKILSTVKIDVLLLNYVEEKKNDFKFSQLVRLDSELGAVPIIYYNVINGDEISFFNGYNNGPIDYIYDGVDIKILANKVKLFLNIKEQETTIANKIMELDKKNIELKKAEAELLMLSQLDRLTGLKNRKTFENQIEFEWARARRNGAFLSLIMIDVDNFKEYNQIHGHTKGDDCLKEIAKMLSFTVVRPSDFLARYDGDHFAVLLPETPEYGAVHLASKILENLELAKDNCESVKGELKISIGISTLIPTNNLTSKLLIDYALEGLKKAKMSNEDKYVVHK